MFDSLAQAVGPTLSELSLGVFRPFKEEVSLVVISFVLSAYKYIAAASL